METDCYLICHFCSCNMGDRYQGYALIQALPEVSFTCVNFNNIGDMEHSIEESMGRLFKVWSPDRIKFDPVKPVIILSGSVDCHSSPIKILSRMTPEQKVFLWGGFHGVVSGKIRGLEVLSTHNITFLARSDDDRKLFKSVSNRDALLGGDPLGLFRPLNSSWSKKRGKVLIASVYLFRFNRPLLEEVLLDEKIDTFVYIDTHSDKDENFQQFMSSHKRETIFTNSPIELQEVIKNCEMVYTSRLHGAVVSLLLRKPVVILSSDGAERGDKSFKFHSVGMSGNGQMCDVVTCPKQLRGVVPRVREENIRGYEALARNSATLIRSFIKCCKS